jgi:hypothetical protein
MTDLESDLYTLGRAIEPRVPDIASPVFHRIVDDDQPDVAGPVARRLLAARRRRLVTVTAVVLAIGVPVAFAAVSRWVIGGAAVSRVATLPAAEEPALTAFGDTMTFDDARRMVDFAIVVPAVAILPSPSEVRTKGTPPGGQVTLVYPASADLPRIGGRNVGATLTELEATTGSQFLDKMVGAGTKVETLTIAGEPAIWLEGAPHVVIYRGRDGIDYTVPTAFAGNVLLWQRGPLLLRLESALPRSVALEIARSAR